MNLRYIAGICALLVTIALVGDIGPSFVRWANRHLDAATPATTCTCPPTPAPPAATPMP